MPGQRGALDPHRELAHAGEGGQLAQLGRAVLGRPGRVARDEPVEAVEERLGLRSRLALEGLRHHRGRGGGDRAAGALEADVLDQVALQLHVDGGAVAAERVVALGPAGGRGQLAEVPRPLAVVEDHFLIKLAQLGGHRLNWGVLAAHPPDPPLATRE